MKMNYLKKTLIVALLIALKANVFALGDVSDRTLSAGVTVPFFYQNIKNDDPVETKIFGVGLNINYRQLFPNSKAGFFTDASVFMPISRSENYDGTSVTSKFNDYEYYFGIDSLSGIYSVLLRSNSIAIPFGAGIHLDGMMSKYARDSSSIKKMGYTAGVGIWSNFEVSVSSSIGFFGGVKVLYDFYYYTSVKGSSNSSDKGLTNSVEVLPAIGLIFHF